MAIKIVFESSQIESIFLEALNDFIESKKELETAFELRSETNDIVDRLNQEQFDAKALGYLFLNQHQITEIK
jgi:hypothetical protein